jgi:hypothetical protein
VADTLNSCFIDKVDELVEKNRNKDSVIDHHKYWWTAIQTLCIFFPISEEETVTVVSKLNSKLLQDLMKSPIS